MSRIALIHSNSQFATLPEVEHEGVACYQANVTVYYPLHVEDDKHTSVWRDEIPPHNFKIYVPWKSLSFSLCDVETADHAVYPHYDNAEIERLVEAHGYPKHEENVEIEVYFPLIGKIVAERAAFLQK